MSEKLDSIFKYFDDHQELYIKRLSDAVAIQSVSAWPEKRNECIKMMEVTAEYMKKELGFQVELSPVANEIRPNGDEIPSPPILLASLGDDPNKSTLCIYGHLDVQPAAVEDGWNTDPFVLVEKDGKLFGRGSTDDKGPVLCWLNCIEAYQKLGIDIPVNLKFVLEGLEEVTSAGLDDLLYKIKDTFLKDVENVCISDNHWLGKNKPCITYGLRGICYFYLEIECANKDLHSGGYGGSVHEAMTDLIHIMSSLVDVNGKILIPGVCDAVLPLSDEEKKIYEDIDFDPKMFQEDIGANKLIKSTKEGLLMNRWRFPSLSLHGIEGAFSGPGSKTVIPGKVIGKFSIRLVPNQKTKDVESLTLKYIEQIHKESGSPNKLNAVAEEGGSDAWVGDLNSHNFTAGKKAMKTVFGIEPDLTREGGSIPVALTFQQIIGKSVLLLPVGACDDGAHSQSEKIDRSNYMNGMKVMAVYLEELSKCYTSTD